MGERAAAGLQQTGRGGVAVRNPTGLAETQFKLVCVIGKQEETVKRNFTFYVLKVPGKKERIRRTMIFEDLRVFRETGKRN